MILIRQIVRYQNERPRALSLGGLPGWCNPRPPTAWPFPMAATGFGPRVRPLPLARLERPQPDERDVAGRHRVIRRFLLHVLPCGFVKIRHFGFLSKRNRRARVARCREYCRRGPRRQIALSRTRPSVPFARSAISVLTRMLRQLRHVAPPAPDAASMDAS